MSKKNKNKKKESFKKWIGKVHLWLGLGSGLIVLLLSVTGCLFVFSQEITNLLRSDEMYVSEIKGTSIPLSELWQKTQSAIGEKTISSATLYNNPEKSVVFTCYKGSEGSYFYFGNIEQFYSVYVNPYTGELLGVYDEELDFFQIVKGLHWSLLLSTPIGQFVIGWATFIFVIMLITGLILWWPKNKAARKQRFKFQWKKSTKWRRKNYDVHNIFGFYIFSVALIIAFTGMVWAFSWFQSIVYVAGAGTTAPPNIIYEKSIVSKGNTNSAFDAAYRTAKKMHTTADAISMSKAADSTAVVNAYIQQNEGTYYIAHALQFDQYTGRLLRERKHDEKNFGEKLITAN
ncbi:MAG: PepSY domain-containing protein, partial [Flavobacterium sp.]